MSADTPLHRRACSSGTTSCAPQDAEAILAARAAVDEAAADVLAIEAEVKGVTSTLRQAEADKKAGA